MDLLQLVEKDLQKSVSSVDDIRKSLNQINSALVQMKEIALKSADNSTKEDDRIQMQNEINQLSYELNQIGNVAGFEQKNFINYGNERTACLCTVAEGVDMSYTTLNGKDNRLRGDLTELIDNYIYVRNGLEQGTDVTITLDINGRAILSGYINEYSTGNQVYPKAYYMTSTVDKYSGGVRFSGYGLSFTIPYLDYIEFLSDGVAQSPKSVNIKIGNSYERVYPYNSLPTVGYVEYYGSGTKLTDFIIHGVDNLTSFYMSGATGNYTSGATSLYVRYTLADGTEVEDRVYNYNQNIKEYLGAGKMRITFNYYSYHNPYYYTPRFVINLPSVYKLTRAGGYKTYKKTSRIVSIPHLYSGAYNNTYLATKPSTYNLKSNQDLIDLDISNPTSAANSITTINEAIKKVQKKLDDISNLKL